MVSKTASNSDIVGPGRADIDLGGMVLSSEVFKQNHRKIEC